MRAIIWSSICRMLVILAVLGFTFGIVKLTNNTDFLWLLWLLFSAWLIPSYEVTINNNKDEEITK